MIGIALFLYTACLNDSVPNNTACFSLSLIGYLVERNRNNLYLNINTVQQRTGYLVQILLYLTRTAYTCLGRMIIVSARAWIHGCNEHQIGGITDCALYAGDGNLPVFQWLGRRTSNTPLLNSGNSSKNKTPLCARLISPGWGKLPPPTIATCDIV